MDGWILRPEKVGREYLFQCDSFFMLWQSAADSVTAFGNDIPRAPPSLENNTKISVTNANNSTATTTITATCATTTTTATLCFVSTTRRQARYRGRNGGNGGGGGGLGGGVLV